MAILVLLISVMNTSGSVDNNTVWQQANRAYKQKQYDSAVFYYEQLAIQKPQNSDIYYNLANAYYRLNEVAPAVLNYERALKIAPEHKQAKENLMLAQERISNRIHSTEPIFFISWWKSITRPGLATLWSVSAFIFFTLFILGIYLKRYSASFSSRIPAQINGALLFIFIILFVLGISSAKNSASDSEAVVMQKDTPLMNNDLKGKPLLLIPEGTTVTIRSDRDGWLEVSLPDGRAGWVRQDQLSRI